VWSVAAIPYDVCQVRIVRFCGCGDVCGGALRVHCGCYSIRCLPGAYDLVCGHGDVCGGMGVGICMFVCRCAVVVGGCGWVFICLCVSVQ